MQPRNIIYEVNIAGQLYGFFIEITSAGKGSLQIPDAGGMADSSPKYPAQLAWLLSKLEEVQGLTRIWPTIWEFSTHPTLNQLKDLFEQEGRVSKKTRADFYMPTPID
jgi:hypothetical protein